jgi:Mitochondrial carrier protein
MLPLGACAKLFEHPFDLVKVRLQSQPADRPPRFKGPLDCFAQTFKNEGFRGLYRVRKWILNFHTFIPFFFFALALWDSTGPSG